MSYLTDDDRKRRQDERADIVLWWLDWLEAQYENLLSREESAMAPAGFDAAPDKVMCEHRHQWKRGKLCLACDNTGWRRATHKERLDEIAADPYAREIPKSIVKVNTSESSKAAQDAAKLDNIINTLIHNESVRNGKDVMEDKDLYLYRQACHKPKEAQLIIACLRRIQLYGFQNFLDRYEIAQLIAGMLPSMMGGRRLLPPPENP